MLADAVVAIHFLWILFLIFGVVFGLRYKAIKVFHLSALAFAVVIQIFDWYCPLTYLEVWLRKMHDPSLSYTGSFIIYYIEKLVYLDISITVVAVLTIVICALNAWLYLRKGGRHGNHF